MGFKVAEQAVFLQSKCARKTLSALWKQDPEARAKDPGPLLLSAALRPGAPAGWDMPGRWDLNPGGWQAAGGPGAPSQTLVSHAHLSDGPARQPLSTSEGKRRPPSSCGR